ncbi:MAG: serine/threonine-protein kinase, partial [Planctomycetota bacterium]
ENKTLQDIILDDQLMSEEDVSKVEKAQAELTRDRERKQDLKFKGYEIISTLGEGGLGSVFKARQVSMNRLVALKVLHLQWLNDDEFRKRFVLEARIVGKLSHQNLIQVYDVSREGDYYYFSMEYVDGRTIEEYINDAPRKQMEIGKAVGFVLQILRAINYYREFDIVHRDIKPSNIMITRSGLAKLGDFGFVKSKLDKELGFDGMVLGTPDYIAPEQAMGKDNVDYRADIYGLGASLYHMLTGRPMYNGTPSRVMLSHTREPIPDPRTYRPSLTQDVCDVLNRMLEKDPSKRYANVNNLFMDLEALRNAHKAKAPIKYELGKSSIMRALNIEKSRHTELADKLKELEGKIDGAEASSRVAWGAVIGAVLAAIVFLVLWLTK